ATLLRKALERKTGDWKTIMLEPVDYAADALHNHLTRTLMERISFKHGGPEYDRRYPDGIPTSVVITDDADAKHDSGLVMYPAGHARNTTADLRGLLDHKFMLLGRMIS